MAIQSLSTESLQPAAALSCDLLAADGSVLRARGEDLSDVHMEFLLKYNVRQVYQVDSADEIEELRDRYNTVTAPPQDLTPPCKLVRHASTRYGGLLMAKGQVCEQIHLDRLVRHGVEAISVHLGTNQQPGTVRFFQALQSYHAKSKLSPAMIRMFLRNWTDVCRDFTREDWQTHSGELLEGLACQGDFAWFFSVSGKARSPIVISMTRDCAAGIAERVVQIPSEQLSDHMIARAVTKLIGISMDQMRRRIESTGDRLSNSPPLPLFGENVEVTLPNVTHSVSFTQQCSFGSSRWIFGVDVSPDEDKEDAQPEEAAVGS